MPEILRVASIRKAARLGLGLGIALAAFSVAASAEAADLGSAFRPPPRAAAPLAAAPSQGPCRLVPQPQLNLTKEDVVGFRPMLVCLSRGVYADTFWPPAATP